MLVLLGGWAFLGDQIGLKQLCGMALAVVGMVAYGVASNQCAPLTPHLEDHQYYHSCTLSLPKEASCVAETTYRISR
jgi:hypothetical protein